MWREGGHLPAAEKEPAGFDDKQFGESNLYGSVYYPVCDCEKRGSPS